MLTSTVSKIILYSVVIVVQTTLLGPFKFFHNCRDWLDFRVEKDFYETVIVCGVGEIASITTEFALEMSQRIGND